MRVAWGGEKKTKPKKPQKTITYCLEDMLLLVQWRLGEGRGCVLRLLLVH